MYALPCIVHWKLKESCSGSEESRCSCIAIFSERARLARSVSLDIGFSCSSSRSDSFDGECV